MKSAKTPPIFLLSFIPALAYWLLESYAGLEWALIGGVVLGLAEMLAERLLTGHVHTLSKLNVGLITVLGLISLGAQEGIWFKLQPSFTGWAVAGFLAYKKMRQESLMLQMMHDLKQPIPLPPEIYKSIETHLGIFLFAFACFMAFVAISLPTATWLFWKTAGFYLIFGGFLVLEFLFIRAKLRGQRP